MSFVYKKIMSSIIIFLFFGCLYSDCLDPFIQHWHNTSEYTLTIKDGKPWAGQKLSPAIEAQIGPGEENDWVLFEELLVTITTPDGTQMGAADLKYSNGNVIDKNGFIQLSYNNSKSHYEKDCWKTYRYFDLKVQVEPPFLPNANWHNGLGNSQSTLVPGNSYWGVDYGLDRWTIKDGAAYQTTAPNQYGGVGSRAFAFNLVSGPPDYKVGDGPGNSFDGLWQIDIKVGSNGDEGFCETFYLAERFDLSPGVENYYDGSGGNQEHTHYSREIDIFETHWKPHGPQINVTYTKGQNQYWNNHMYQSQQMGDWKDIDGAPSKGFITVGALIRENNLWIYAYKPDGTLWYCTEAIPNNNMEYTQKGVFTPYIGTWKNGGSAIFETGYNNFIYLKQDNQKIAGKNPKDHPDSFGPALR